jgi:hypothetical protein
MVWIEIEILRWGIGITNVTICNQSNQIRRNQTKTIFHVVHKTQSKFVPILFFSGMHFTFSACILLFRHAFYFSGMHFTFSAWFLIFRHAKKIFFGMHRSGVKNAFSGMQNDFFGMKNVFSGMQKNAN